MRLLPEAERTEAIRGMADAEKTYRREGGGPALRAMASLVGLDFAHPDLEPGVEIQAPATAERAAILAFFFTHDLPAVRNCELGIADLAGPGRIIPAAGRTSRGIAPRRCAEELAGRLGVGLAEFPGGHSGLTMRPTAFAQRLCDVVDGAHR